MIIGCGNIAGGYDLRSQASTIMTHAGAFARSDRVGLVGAFDPDSVKLAEFCEVWKCQAASSVAELLSNHRPEVVSICSPNETHYSILKEVIASKPLAVICEKPLALELAKAQEMVRLTREAGIILAVNYIRRWDSALAEVKKRLLSGELGTIRSGRVVYTKGLFHNASHGINLFEAWLGPVKRVKWLKRMVWLDQDPCGDFELTFAGDIRVQFHWCDSSDYSIFEMELFTSEARVLLSGGGTTNVIFRRIPSKLVPGTFVLSESPEIILGTLDKVMAEVVENVARTILLNDHLRMSAEEALATTETCVRLRDQLEG